MKNNLKNYIDLKALLKATLAAINRSKDFMGLIKFDHDNDKKSVLIPVIFESKMLEIAQEKYPELDLIHPSDDCRLGDIYSKKLKTGIELKICQGQGKQDITSWENGSIQNHCKYFLFVRTCYVNGKLIIKFAFYEYMSYSQWTVHNGGMRIGIRKVKQFCEQII